MSETSSSTVHWIVQGRVQGVYYRYFTQQAARRLGLVGWVRNLPDGSVELQAVGTPETLGQLRRSLEEGPPMARVDQIVELEPTAEDLAAAGGWQEFEIRY